MDYVKGIDRNQLFMMNLEEHVAVDSWARIVDVFVDILPLDTLGFKDVLNTEGRPPYRSSDLLKLYIYGFRKQIRSSRKLEEACKNNLEVMWLLRGVQPSARKIAYFRKRHPKAFKAAFRHFVLLLKEMKLIDGRTIAVDSFKVRAQNSLKNNFNQGKITRHLAYIDKKIGEYESALEESEEESEREKLNAKIALQKKRKAKYNELSNQLNETGERQISTTDVDARAVILHRNIVNVGYNIQAGTDSKNKLFVNVQTGWVNDTHALYPMALEAKELLGKKRMKVIADKGYTTGEQIALCGAENIITYCSPKAHSSAHNGLYPMKDFKYSKRKDTYTCPAGATLTTNGNYYKKGKHQVKHYKTKSCKGCTQRDACTRNKMGRFIERGLYQADLEKNERRVTGNMDLYRQRQEIIEHQFGTLKRQWGFTYVLMKGKEHVLGEASLAMMTYNLVRLMNIFGIEALKRLLKRCLLLVFANSRPFKPLSAFKIFKKFVPCWLEMELKIA